jgi:hypothetical protein
VVTDYASENGAEAPPRRPGKPAKWTLPDPERQFREYLREYADSEASKLDYVRRHPVKSVKAAVAVRRLPVLTTSPSNCAEGEAIRKALRQLSTPLGTAAVLMIPDCPADFGQGAGNQTLRRKVRLAQRLGVTWSVVDDPEERRELLDTAVDFERTHPIERYRSEEADHRDMVGFRLWGAAYAADGRPVLLSVTAMDGEWALIRYFRSIGMGEEQSNARYLALHELGKHLAGTGVHYLFDGVDVSHTPEGLRHFQRMVGFRVMRLREEK